MVVKPKHVLGAESHVTWVLWSGKVQWLHTSHSLILHVHHKFSWEKKLFLRFYILNVLFGPKHAVYVWHSISSFAAERNARGHGRAGEWCKQMTILSGAEQIRPKRYLQYTDSASTHHPQYPTHTVTTALEYARSLAPSRKTELISELRTQCNSKNNERILLHTSFSCTKDNEVCKSVMGTAWQQSECS